MTRSGRGLLNYTTEVKEENTVNEIEAILRRSGAKGILKNYDNTSTKELMFNIEVGFGATRRDMGFRLPMNTDAIVSTLNKQVQEKRIPRRYYQDIPQARRVGWRIMKDWTEAQLAIIETQMVEVQQVFLPYAVARNGQTFYEQLKSQEYRMLLPEKGED